MYSEARCYSDIICIFTHYIYSVVFELHYQHNTLAWLEMLFSATFQLLFDISLPQTYMNRHVDQGNLRLRLFCIAWASTATLTQWELFINFIPSWLDLSAAGLHVYLILSLSRKYATV